MGRTWDDFPVCDDTTEYGDIETPSPKRSLAAADFDTDAPPFSTQQYDDGPRTAPLLSTHTWHGGPPHTPLPRRQHQRTPSGGVFFMSLDDESSAASDSSQNQDFKALFKLSEKHKAKKPFFASSMFQNSPSADDLPPPSFGSSA